MSDQEETEAEHMERHAPVDALVAKIGETIVGAEERDALDAICLILGSVCADCNHPDATLVDAISFVTDFFRDITSNNEELEPGEPN